jgi:hypothetical protein
VFTAAGPRPHTRAARSFLRQCAVPDAGALYDQRRAEDRAVLTGLGVDVVHLGLADALYRRRTAPVRTSRHLGRVLPELVHRYPTYRFDIAKGRVARGDHALIADLTGRVRRLLDDTAAELLFCPLGVGRHVDHIIVRTVGERFPDKVVYYSDFPYNQSYRPNLRFIARHRLQPWSWHRGIDGKERLIRGYRTQADLLFPTGRIPAVAETYFLTAS